MSSILHLPAYFGSQMILQQSVRTSIYGQARPHSKVKILLEIKQEESESLEELEPEQYKLVFADEDLSEKNGFFNFRLPALEASLIPYRLSLFCLDEILILEDILVGEVWLAAGESNMAQPVRYSDLRDLKKQVVKNDKIRFFSMARTGLAAEEKLYSYEPRVQIAEGRWQSANSYSAIEDLSAVAFSFALELQQSLNLPIGIYDLATYDSLIHSWLPREIIEEDPIIKNHVKETKNYRDEENWNQLPPPEKKQDRRANLHFAQEDKAMINLPFERINQPAALFNHKIAPFTNLAIRGILWMQGESDCHYPTYYARAFKSLVKVWSQLFIAPTSGLKLIYTQLAPYFYSSWDMQKLSIFNESLVGIRRHLAIKSGIIPIYDLGLNYDLSFGKWGRPLNPLAKAKIGQRMKDIALGLAYKLDFPSSAPECVSAEYVGKKLLLTFENTGRSLNLGPGTKELKGFAVCSEDYHYFPAEAKELYGVRILVWHDEIEDISSCTYAFSDFNHNSNLYGGEDIPVLPFRMDNASSKFAEPMDWTYCDRLESWIVPSTDVRYSKMELNDLPGFYPSWQVKSGRAKLSLEEQHKKTGEASFCLDYRRAADRAIVFEPVLYYASLYPPLDISAWQSLVLTVFNSDHAEKEITLKLIDVNNLISLSAQKTIKKSLEWQEIKFNLKDLAVDLVRIDSLEFILVDDQDQGSLYIDRIDFREINQSED